MCGVYFVRMSRSYRFPLFAAMRSDGRTLVVQIADALRQAILTGFYASGELLPPMRELCFPVPLAHVVMDPVASGRKVAHAALSYLTGHGIPSDAVIKPAYMRGPSFPVGNFAKKGSKR